MRTFYYIAKRKPRNRRLQYAGDGLVDADTKKEARETVARRYGVSEKNVKLEEKVEFPRHLISDPDAMKYRL